MKLGRPLLEWGMELYRKPRGLDLCFVLSWQDEDKVEVKHMVGQLLKSIKQNNTDEMRQKWVTFNTSQSIDIAMHAKSSYQSDVLYKGMHVYLHTGYTTSLTTVG